MHIFSSNCKKGLPPFWASTRHDVLANDLLHFGLSEASSSKKEDTKQYLASFQANVLLLTQVTNFGPQKMLSCGREVITRCWKLIVSDNGRRYPHVLP